MNTKNIMKALAMAMLMPAMLFTSCSKDKEVIPTIDDNTAKKGYPLQVTVNVTCENDDTPAGSSKTMRAEYNESTKKLEFSAGDKLFVYGSETSAGSFAGTLDWVSEGTFSGTMTIEHEWAGTSDALFSAASTISATLLPAGYGTYGYLTIKNSGYDAYVYPAPANAFAASTKAAGVEQLSLEEAAIYSSGFALSPQNAILNFTITGLTPNTGVTATLNSGSGMYILNLVSGNVTANAAGEATFAMGVTGGTYNIKDLTLSIGGNTIDITNSSKTLVAGNIYNITRSVIAYPIDLSDATSVCVGNVVTTDAKVYPTVAAATADSKTAVAIIAYVGSAGSVDASSASYKGLAIALSDANSGSECAWAGTNANCLSSQTSDITSALGFKNGISCTGTLTGDGHTHAAAAAAASNNSASAPTGTSGWFLPSMGQWNLIVQGLATMKTGSAVTTDLPHNTDNDTYKASNLNSVITAAGGTGFGEHAYWSSTEVDANNAWYMYFKDGCASYGIKDSRHVRSVLAF